LYSKLTNPETQKTEVESSDILKDMIYQLDQKIGIVYMFEYLASIEKVIDDLKETGDAVAKTMERDHLNQVKVVQSHIDSVFEQATGPGTKVEGESNMPVSFTTILLSLVVVMSIFVYWKFYQAKKTHML
jgi:hypothetical protein